MRTSDAEARSLFTRLDGIDEPVTSSLSGRLPGLRVPKDVCNPAHTSCRRRRSPRDTPAPGSLRQPISGVAGLPDDAVVGGMGDDLPDDPVAGLVGVNDVASMPLCTSSIGSTSMIGPTSSSLVLAGSGPWNCRVLKASHVVTCQNCVIPIDGRGSVPDRSIPT